MVELLESSAVQSTKLYAAADGNTGGGHEFGCPGSTAVGALSEELSAQERTERGRVHDQDIFLGSLTRGAIHGKRRRCMLERLGEDEMVG